MLDFYYLVNGTFGLANRLNEKICLRYQSYHVVKVYRLGVSPTSGDYTAADVYAAHDLDRQ